MAVLLTLVGVALALPLLILLGVFLGPAAFLLLFGAGCAALAAFMVWTGAHAKPR